MKRYKHSYLGDPQEKEDGEWVKYQDHMSEITNITVSLNEIRGDQCKKLTSLLNNATKAHDELLSINNKLIFGLFVAIFIITASLMIKIAVALFAK